jgi:tetratricopeptide (TPR) repeat protein
MVTANTDSNLSVEQLVSRAKKASKRRDYLVASQLYASVLQQQPNHPVAKKALRKLAQEDVGGQGRSVIGDPPQVEMTTISNLYRQGQLLEAQQGCERLLTEFPRSLFLAEKLGLALARQGKFPAALVAFSLAIEIQPNKADAYSNLGNIQQSMNDFAAAENSYRAAVKINPCLFDALHNLSVMLQKINRYEDALIAANMALELSPKSSEGYHNQSVILQSLERFEQALQANKQALTLKPECLSALKLKGGIEVNLSRWDDALASFEKMIAQNPDSADGYFGKALALDAMGRFAESVDNYAQAIKFKPGFVEAYCNLGKVQRALGELTQALSTFEMAIEIQPSMAIAHYNYAAVLDDVGRYEDAMASYKRAIALKADYVSAYTNLGNLQNKISLTDEAEASYLSAIAANPSNPVSHLNFGVFHYILGNKAEAIVHCQTAVDMNSSFSQAHGILAELKTYKENDPQITTMKDVFLNQDSSEHEKMLIAFPLAKSCHDIGAYADSFMYLNEGNRRRKAILDFSIGQDEVLFSHLESTYSSQKAAKYSAATDMHSPIFIVGMPRSGTSLVEQIVATHQDVYGAGELGVMEDTAKAICLKQLNAKGFDPDGFFTHEQFQVIRDRYTNALGGLNVSEKIITDKMPVNFKWIGVIQTIFPTAKIIHVNRDPMATCWSIYQQNFIGTGNGFSYDLEDIYRFYNMYRELMAFWQTCFPDKIYNLQYEGLTENQEAETRRLLKFCDLEWSDQCLDFHNNSRQVRTASALQVREKMYQNSSQEWRKYASHLTPLIVGLGYEV